MELETWHAPSGDRIPNHPRFAVLLYHGVEDAAAAYPAGQEDYDLLPGDDPAEVAAARERIARLGPPDEDPVGGDGVAGWL